MEEVEVLKTRVHELESKLKDVADSLAITDALIEYDGDDDMEYYCGIAHKRIEAVITDIDAIL